MRLCMSRQPQADEVQHLIQVFRQERQSYQLAPEQALALIGELDGNQTEPHDLAAWFVVASILLNLDETITKG